MKGDSRRLFAAAIPAVTLLLLLAFVFYLPRVHQTDISLLSQAHRRLLQIDSNCNIDDFDVHQGQSAPLPNGIPTYTVSVLNLCSIPGGCSLGNVHLSCEAFASTVLIDPKIFRRLSIDDCLLNDGLPLAPGSVVSFQYANSFSYPLAVSNATCVH